jgi:hypothetical protein
MNYKDDRLSLKGVRGSMMSLGSEYPSIRNLLAPDYPDVLTLQEALIGCRLMQIIDASPGPVHMLACSEKFPLLGISCLFRSAPGKEVTIYSETGQIDLKSKSDTLGELIDLSKVKRAAEFAAINNKETTRVAVTDPIHYQSTLDNIQTSLRFWLLLVDYAYLKASPIAARFRKEGLQVSEHAEGFGEVFRL